MKLVAYAVCLSSLLVCGSVSASDWNETEDDTPGIVFGNGYVRIQGKKYIPEDIALVLAERQTLALEKIANRLETLGDAHSNRQVLTEKN